MLDLLSLNCAAGAEELAGRFSNGEILEKRVCRNCDGQDAFA
jgi:hypothetical protein